MLPVLRALTQLPDEGHEFLVLAQWQDGALVRSYGGGEAEELQGGNESSKISAGHQNFCFQIFTDRSLLVALPDVECVLEDGVHDPADAEGRLDDVGNDLLHCGHQTENTSLPGSVPEMFAAEQDSPCRVFWNRFTDTMSFVSLNAFPSVSMVNSLEVNEEKINKSVELKLR